MSLTLKAGRSSFRAIFSKASKLMPSPLPVIPVKERPSGLIPGLELIRGMASLQVFFSHLFLMFVFNNVPPTGRPFWMEAFLTWSSEAVLVFFVLSGLVIAISQRNQSRDRIHFFRARLRRLSPLYLAAILLGFVVDRILSHHFTFTPLWGHLLFLQAYNVPATPLFHSNLPLWSLSFEFYFYMLFSLTIGTRFAGMRSALWTAGFLSMTLFYFGWQAHGIAGHLEEIVAYMPVWLLGVTLIEKPIYFRPSLGQNFVLFSIMFLVARSFYSATFYPPGQCLLLALLIAPLLYSLTNPERKADPKSAVSSWLIVGLIYLLAAAMMMLLVPNRASYPYWSINLFWLFIPPITALLVWISPLLGAMRVVASPAWHPAALFLGRISYALYVVHMPICSLVHYKTYSVPLRISLDIGLVFVLAWFLEYRVHPYLCRKFDRVWPNRIYKSDASLSRSQTCSI